MNEELLDLISDILGVSSGNLDMTSVMDDIDEWDSLNHLRLVAAVEQEFSIRLDMDEIESIDSVQSLQAAISRHSI